MAIIKMTPAQYATRLKGTSTTYNSKQAVLYRIAEGLDLIGVVKRENILGRNVLTVNTDKLVPKNSKKKVA
jgi:hypothetical protein